MEKPLVLLVDDDDATCTLMRAVLSPEFTVEAVGDGAVGIDRLRTKAYSVVLLDLLMPGVDGYAVLDMIRKERPDLLSRVVIVTAAMAPRDQSRLQDYTLGGIIGKPFEIEELFETVRRLAHGPDHRGPRLGPLLAGGLFFLAHLMD